MAQSGHPTLVAECPLSGVKRTPGGLTKMSAFDPKQTLAAHILGLPRTGPSAELRSAAGRSEELPKFEASDDAAPLRGLRITSISSWFPFSLTLFLGVWGYFGRVGSSRGFDLVRFCVSGPALTVNNNDIGRVVTEIEKPKYRYFSVS
jgi:hypothetical protein